MTTARRNWILLVLAAAAIAAMAAAMWPARSAAAADKGATKLTLAAPSKGLAGSLILSAKLTGPDGKPVANAPVDFTFQVDFMTQKQALLGTVPTDTSGTATYVYRLQNNGPVQFGASFAGSATLAATASALVPFTVTGGPGIAPAAPASSRLSLVGRWVPWAALALVASVWVTLIAVAVRTLVVIPSASRGFVPEPGVAGELATQGWQTASDQSGLETN